LIIASWFLLVNGSAPPPPVANKAPVAIASADVTAGKAPLAVSFTGDRSYDPDGTITAYHWDFGDTTFSSEANPVHTYTGTDTYLTVLTVTDNNGQSPDSAALEIKVRRSNGRKK
jgi:PKD repeat protein